MPLQSRGVLRSIVSIMFTYESRIFFNQTNGDSIRILSFDTLKPRRRAPPVAVPLLLPLRFAAAFFFLHDDQKLVLRRTTAPCSSSGASSQPPSTTRLYGLLMHCIRVIAGANTNTRRLPIARTQNSPKIRNKCPINSASNNHSLSKSSSIRHESLERKCQRRFRDTQLQKRAGGAAARNETPGMLMA